MFIKGNLTSKIFLKATRGTLKSSTRARAIRAVSIIRKPLSPIHAATRIQVHPVTWQQIIWLISSHIATVSQPVETDALQKEIKYHPMVAAGCTDLPAVTSQTSVSLQMFKGAPQPCSLCIHYPVHNMHFCIWFLFQHLIIFTFLPNCHHQVSCRFKTWTTLAFF